MRTELLRGDGGDAKVSHRCGRGHSWSCSHRVLQAFRVPNHFHARHAAISRTYLYLATGCPRPDRVPVFGPETGAGRFKQSEWFE